jgi:hypothetical protein
MAVLRYRQWRMARASANVALKTTEIVSRFLASAAAD